MNTNQNDPDHGPARSKHFVRHGLALGCLLLLGSCAQTTEPPDSSSHFVDCREDARCGPGVCANGYCEYDGEKVSQQQLDAIQQRMDARETTEEPMPEPRGNDAGPMESDPAPSASEPMLEPGAEIPPMQHPECVGTLPPALPESCQVAARVGFPFVIGAASGHVADGTSTGKVTNPDPGTVCLEGTLSDSPELAAMDLYGTTLSLYFGLDDALAEPRSIDLEGRGITAVEFTVDSPPPGGVRASLWYQEGEEWRFGVLTNEDGSDRVIGSETVRADFDAFGSIDTSRVVLFVLGGMRPPESQLDYAMCLTDFRFLDAEGNEVLDGPLHRECVATPAEQPPECVVDDGPGIPYVMGATRGGDGVSTAKVENPTPGTVCLQGTLAARDELPPEEGSYGAALSLDFAGLDMSTYFVIDPFDAEARGIVGVELTVENPPPGGVLPHLWAVFDGNTCTDDCLLLEDFGPFVLEYSDGAPRLVTATETLRLRFEDFHGENEIDPSRLTGLALGGMSLGEFPLDYRTCVKDVSFFDADGVEVTAN